MCANDLEVEAAESNGSIKSGSMEKAELDLSRRSEDRINDYLWLIIGECE